MAKGPGGSGVRIVQPDQVPVETNDARRLRQRQERRAQMDLHEEQQAAFQEEEQAKGVIIQKATSRTVAARKDEPVETQADRKLRERVERRERMDAHQEAQEAYIEEQNQKMDREPIEDKMDRPVKKTKAERVRFDAAGLEDLDRDELAALAEEHGIKVERSDGRTDLDPTLDDYRTVLSD